MHKTKQYRHIALILTLLLLGSVVNEAWATKVTYHIITLPMNHETLHTQAKYDGWRMEAVRVIVDVQTEVRLPDHFKSPLAKNFKYWSSESIRSYGTAQNIYEKHANKYFLFQINGEQTPSDDSDDASPLTEGDPITSNSDIDIYVTYEYNPDNTIAKLDGSVNYNVRLGDGFLAYNRGRNNRPCVIPKQYVSDEQLISDDFVFVDVSKVSSEKITTYFDNSNENKNPKANVQSQFYFLFKYLGEDPYNITITSAYDKDKYFIEMVGLEYKGSKWEKNTTKFYKKTYKDAILYSKGTDNLRLTSDAYVGFTTEVTSPTWDNDTPVSKQPWPGLFRNDGAPVWNSFAILNATDGSGSYVYMTTRTVNNNGTFNGPTKKDEKYQYFYLKSNHNNLYNALMTPDVATRDYATDEYKLTTVNFKVPTPFYDPEGTTEQKAAHTVTASIEMSEYTFSIANITDADIPASLKRKYCNINGYYKDAARTEPITKYSDLGEGRDVYLGYEVLPSIPFKAVASADTTWYELTDAASSQVNGKKLKWDGSSNYKNNGADGDYAKTSEFAFIGDPYELRVISRSKTWDAGTSNVSYLGAAGANPATETPFTASTTATAGYLWEIPDDDTYGSFLLRKMKGEGHWYWATDHLSGDYSYTTASHTINVPNSNAQNLTLNITNLTYAEGNYIKVTAGGTDASQVTGTTPTLTTGTEHVSSDGKATVTATISARGASDKTFTLTIQEYNSSNATVGTATVITINQNASTAYAGNAVQYNTSSSTRIKVMELPKRTFTYKIVNLEGNVAAKASVSQPIFSPLSLASIPSIIVSPFLVGETLTFYDSYTDNNSDSKTTRFDFHNPSEQTPISETPNVNHDIFVTYTTAHLQEKPIMLSEDQEFFVKLNGQYIYYDTTTKGIKSSSTSEDTKAYKWLLRSRDPYGMLIDNLGARDDNSVSGRENVTLYYDNGAENNTTRDKGAWVQVADGTWGNDKALEFTTTRASASRFIAKSSGALGTSTYEVMAADGSVDASTTYYNIGRSAVDVVKIYSNATYVHGHDVLKFELEANAKITYHLIDKSKADLLQVDSRSPDLFFPNEYRSPLVATYHYWQASAFVDANPDGGTDFSFDGSPSELSSVGELTDAEYNDPETSTSGAWDAATSGFKLTATTEDNMIAQVKLLTTTGTYYFKIGSDTYKSVEVTAGHKSSANIYVTYDTDEQFGFGTRSPYTLKFLNGASYYLEDGNDKLTSTKLKAVYPYCNGDGHLNIYGQRMNDEQMNGGSSTRPRWVWFMESENRDPYHVKIHSRSAISFNGASNSTYLQTYAVHFNQDKGDDANKQRIVTGGNLAGISQVAATEYMILGEKILGEPTKYKLLTTNKIAADLDGDGNTTDDGENERRYVTSFEQYWKTYNMLKQCVLGFTKDDDEFSEDPETFVMPSDKWSDLKTQLTSLGINSDTEMNYVDGCVWHSYSAAANALRWNGFDDKGKANTKKVEILEHWFQTFDMGDGTFEIESADIPPVLVLLDRHGWEIMRKPLPIGADPVKTAALKAYDSPMVKEYQFYNNATKAANCHKYTLRTQNGALRDEIKVDGVPFTSTSLGTLPPIKADQYGTYPDVYVTYTVKDEYEKSFRYSLTADTTKNDAGEITAINITSETFTASKFVIVQNARYARNTFDGKDDSYFSKPVSQGTEPTGGNVYDMILNPSTVAIGQGTSAVVDVNKDGKIDNNILWYIQPNLEIDEEMGIPWATKLGNDNEPLTKNETKAKYKDKTGFDPYNIQLKNVDTNQFFTMNLSSTGLSNGAWEGTLGSNDITLATATSSGFVTPEGYDHTTLQITKQTFMAVSDANGNMQLMPRFDHTKRIDVATGSPYHNTLQAPKDHTKAVVTDNKSMGPQTVFFVRPQVFEYHIIDNDGNEALRYKSAGEYSPDIPEKYKSPLATDFKYYYDNTTNTVTTATADEWNSATELYKRTALHADSVAHQARLLPAKGDYFFRIGTDPSSYSYKKVSVTAVKEITGLFAEAGLDEDVIPVYVRYSYDDDADIDGANILQGKWFTMNLAGKDVQSSGTIVTTADPSQGTGVSLYADEATPTKPGTVDQNAKKWQWKFLSSPSDISSPYYRPADPYAVQIFNRAANYSNDLSVEPNPMGVGIKVNGKNRFAILSHPTGGYALAVAGLGSYSNSFLNGASMTAPSTTAATTVEECYQKTVSDEAGYTALKATLEEGDDAIYYIKINGTEVTDDPEYKKVTITSNVSAEENVEETDWENAYISPGAKLLLNDEVAHSYVYNVITNDASGKKLAISETQTKAEAEEHHSVPYLPEDIQTPLLNTDDYIYYGSATIDKNSTPEDPSDDTYTMIEATKLFTLYGLYDDVVYVRYKAYDPDNTGYLVPNKKTVVDDKVAKDAGSNDVALNISGKLPYNIYWHNDNMMKRGDDDAISYTASHDLSGDATYIWLIEGNDPYALHIKHKNSEKYVNGTGTLNASPKKFMLLKKTDYDYGILQETGGTNKLTGYGNSLTSGDPTKFIMFGLSTHKLIYHLVINTTNVNTSIPYRTGTESSPGLELGTKNIPGTTQRDLVSENDGAGYHYAGEKYQLGSTIMGRTYSVDAGEVSLGDDLAVPNEFDRPNCIFFYYIHNIQKHGDTGTYQKTAADKDAMEAAATSLASGGYYYYNVGDGTSYYRAHNDGETIIIVDCTEDDWSNAWQDDDAMNAKYKGLEVTKLMSDAGIIGGLVNVNVAYAFQTGLETNAGEGFVTSVDQNLWYTFETQNGSTPFLAHYTNAWGLQAMEGRETRYTNDYLWTPLGDVYGFRMYNRYMIKNSGGTENVMTMASISEGANLLLHLPDETYTVGNEVFELLPSNTPGFFRIHPVINHTGTRYYVRKDPSDNYAKLSTTSSEWTFNLPAELLTPYVERKGYVGGLKETAYTANKTVLDKLTSGTASYADLLNIQGIVYNDANIVKYEPGYYRLHSQPGVSDISPVRYASGYLHKTELTGDGVLTTAAIPLHFYSKKGTSTTFTALENGFTYSHATRGPIPVPATEYDPSSVFYFKGSAVVAPANPVSTMQTQGLYVAENNGNGLGTNREKRAVMSASSNDAISLTLMDIGGAVLLIHDGAVPADRRYLNFDQSNCFQRTATDTSDYDAKKVALTSVGVYYFKIGSSTYKRVTVTALSPYTYSETDVNSTDWERAADIYDLKYYHDSPTDDAKWCMEPANNQGLLVETHSGGDGYYYATFYAPYDLKLPDNVAADLEEETPAKNYYAYICTEWNTKMLHPVKTGNDGKDIPANTPVIIRTDDKSGNVKLSFPTSALSSAAGNIFTGSYLEQLLATQITASDKVYTFGLPITGYGLVTDAGATNGNITNYIDRSQDYTGVGFYINATQNKELSEETGQWTPNNRYVLHNKIYYRAGSSGASARRMNSARPEFVPVIFDDEEPDIEEQGQEVRNDNRIYDLLGRCVADEAEVRDGSWQQRLAPGIYILNGRKFSKK